MKIPKAKCLFVVLIPQIFFYCKTTSHKAITQVQDLPEKVPAKMTETSDNTLKDIHTGMQIDLSPPIRRDTKTSWPVLKEKKKKRKSPVYYSGDQFIRETKYNPFFKKKEIAMSISGNALIKSGSNELKAPLLTVYGENSALAHAPNSIKIKDKKNLTEISAREGLFLRNENRILLRGNAQSVHYLKKKKRTIRLRADEMERLADSEITIARGQVAVSTDGIYAYGRKATYYERESRLVFSEEPKIYRENDIVTGDEIEIFLEEKKAHFKRNVKVYFAEQSKGEKKNALVTGIAQAATATYTYGPENPLERNILLRRDAQKSVTIDRNSDFSRADQVQIFGDQTEIVIATGRVNVRQKSDGTTMHSEYFKHMRVTGLLQMKSTRDKRIRPRIDFYDKNGKKTGELTSDLIERTHLASDIQARGNVVLVMTEENENVPKTSLGGSWADLKDNPMVIKFFGNPFVSRGDKKIFATQIQLFPREGRYEMSGFLHGTFE